jgi:phosphate-selective porin OprO/OprP
VETAGNWNNFYAQAGYYDFEVDRAPVAFKVFTSAATSVTQIVQPSSNSFNGWYVQGSWVLTGENKGYNSATGAFTPPKPDKAFSLDGSGWGALELVGRYSDLDLNDHENDQANVITAWTGATTRTYTYYNTVRGGEQKAFTLGLNWYPNEAVRFALDYQLIDLSRLQSGATPNAITGITTTTTGVPTIPAVSADQTVQAVALRAQIAF